MHCLNKILLNALAIFLVLKHCTVQLVQLDTDELLPLGKQSPTLGPIKILEFEPTPEEFYRDFIRKSQPVVIRTKNPSWLKYFRKWNSVKLLQEEFSETIGKVYKRSIWTKGWPIEIRMKFGDFIKEAQVNKRLYWDSLFSFNSPLLKYIPMPLYFRYLKFLDWIAAPVLLVTFNNASSVFHHDTAENFFFQISGKKSWLLAHPSSANLAYANDYDVFPGLSPIEPDKVNLTRYPLVKNISFYEITIEPGDFLYVPQHWWHHVRSSGAPTVALGFWAEMFTYPYLDDFNVINYTKVFGESLQSEPETLSCPWQQVTLQDVKREDFESAFMTYSQFANEEKLLYFGSDGDSFYCVDSTDGSVVWKHSVKGDAGSTPVVSRTEPYVYFADESGKVYSFSILRNRYFWTAKIKDGVVASLRLSKDDNILIVASLDHRVYALNTESGEKNWKSEPLGGEIWSSPVLIQNKVLITVDVKNETTPAIYLFDCENGNVIWNYTTGTSVFATPTVDRKNNLAYVVDLIGNIHVMNLISGERTGFYETGEGCFSSPVINANDDRLYIVTNGGKILCFDLKSFEVIWQIDFFIQSDMVMSSPLISTSTNILYQCAGASLYALNASTGDVIWKFTTEETFVSSPRIDRNGIIYVGGVDKYLYAINGKDGSLIWSFKTSGPVISSVAMTSNFFNQHAKGSLL